MGPPVRVLGVEATTSYVDGQPRREALTEGEVLSGVTRTASLVVHFDRFLLPHRVIRQSLCVRPVLDEVTSIEDCVEPFQAFTEPEYNPVARTVTYRLGLGERFEAQTTYRITIFVPETAQDTGFFAFDGTRLERRYVFDFETQAAGGAEVEEVLPGKEAYCAAIACFENCDAGDQACLDDCRGECVEPTCTRDGELLTDTPLGGQLFTGCATLDCHRPNHSGEAPDPSVLPMGLDLDTIAGLSATAIGKVAHQTQTGQSATEPVRSPQRFGRAMPIIDPGNPGNSYLLYKVIANPLNHPRGPDGLLEPALVQEIQRLRESIAVGLPMPADPEHPVGIADGDPLGEQSYARMMLMHHWIANGAVTRCE